MKAAAAADQRPASTPVSPNRFLETLKRQAESALGDPLFDFIATYHAVADLRRIARQAPGLLDHRTITAVEQLLRSGAFTTVRQAYFLFREAASVMTDMVVARPSGRRAARALASLAALLRDTHGSAHRGVAEALGGLPVPITGPRPPGDRDPSPATVDWTGLLAARRLRAAGRPWYIGRSLVVQTTANRLLVVKLAHADDAAAGLAAEIGWMERLRQPAWAVDRRFHIPDPVTLDNRRVIRLRHLPLPPPPRLKRHPDRLAIAFLAHPDYFVYPNQGGVSGPAACEMLGRNAYLMGHLTASGVIHDAPIPLFHNRTQRLRRDDQGRYQWYRSGRLDQWLASCAHPNLGLSGLRDFEHLISFTGTGRGLYRHIGGHLLSLLLVAGSHFRARERQRIGWDAAGNPVDARDLFDRHLLKQMVQEIFANYHTGFAGSPPALPPPVDVDHLADRMIDEMGVDRYMIEWLRRTDQQALSDETFATFLMSRGYRAGQIEGLVRGAEDMRIVSGPHLGDFNRQISLPELIESVAAMAAMCIAGRYRATTAA